MLVLAGWLGGIVGVVLLFPLAAGVTVALARPSWALDWVAGFERWVTGKRSAIAGQDTVLARYLTRPSLGGLAKIRDWTEGVADEFARCGVRTASYLYFSSIAGLVVYFAAVAVVVVVAMILGILIGLWLVSVYVGSKSTGGAFWRGYSLFAGSGSSGSSARSRLFDTSITKEGLFFDKPTGIKVNEQGQVMQEGLLFDKPTGIKINEEGQIVSEGVIFDKPSGLRVNEDGQLVREGIIFETPSGYKVNEQGEVVEEGVLFDKKTGINLTN